VEFLLTTKRNTMNITDSIVFGIPAVGLLLVVLAMALLLLFLAYHSFQPVKYQHENSGKDVFSTAMPFALIWASGALVVLLTGNVVMTMLAIVLSSVVAFVVLKKHTKRVSQEYSE